MEETSQDLRSIARAAAASYNQVASGYNDPSHETVRNFEVVTLDFLRKTLFKKKVEGQRILDLGGGRAYASRRMALLGAQVFLGDVSIEMLRCTRRDSGEINGYCNLSAFDLPFQDNTFDMVMTLLCGAYLTDTSVKEIFRILKPSGTYFVTETPTEWARAIQPQRDMPIDKIWFKDPNGKDVLLPFSFIYTLNELVDMLNRNGFHIVHSEMLKPGNSIPFEKIAKVNKDVAYALGLSPQDIPLLSAVIAVKNGVKAPL